jgi:transcription elongation factor SPT6
LLQFCLSSSTDSYIEVLDGSRVHPETYEWARKMAVDALEYDESAEDANPAGALEEILENPERLKDLDLDAFAEELERQVGDYRPWQARTHLKQLCRKGLG